MTFDPMKDYPLGTERPDLVTTAAGLSVDDVTLEAAREGRVLAPELSATPDTLRLQAQVANARGRTQLAESLERAAELAAVPDDLLLEVYTALRPGRATARDLELWALRLEEFEAEKTAAFVREASAAYTERGLLAHD
jgi:propanediol dehydratase small subunit